MKKITIIFFVVMCLAQWIVPGKMIYDSENTIAAGTLYKFKTAPIDPSDPIRGKYVVLSFRDNFFHFSDSAEWQRGQQLFATFTTDSAGFAIIENVYHSRPESDSYLQTVVERINHYGDEHTLWYKLPFDRFYLEESKAPQAEELYRNAQRDTTQVAYVLVSIGAGKAVLQDVIINDRPILELINELNERNE